MSGVVVVAIGSLEGVAATVEAAATAAAVDAICYLLDYVGCYLALSHNGCGRLCRREVHVWVPNV